MEVSPHIIEAIEKGIVAAACRRAAVTEPASRYFWETLAREWSEDGREALQRFVHRVERPALGQNRPLAAGSGWGAMKPGGMEG